MTKNYQQLITQIFKIMKTLNTITRLFTIVFLAVCVQNCTVKDFIDTPDDEIVTEACVNNTPYEISGWNQTDSYSYSFVENMINGTFSHDGKYLFIGADYPDNRQYRFPLSTAWDIQTISTDYDQLNTSYNVFSVFANEGQYRFRKLPLSSLWQRQILTENYNLQTISIDDESEFRTPEDFMTWSTSGNRYYGLHGNTLFQYTTSENWSLEAPVDTYTINVNSIIPQDELVLKGVQFSLDGTKAFIYKSAYQAPFSATVYEIELSVPFSLETAIYTNVSMSFTTTSELNSFQFADDGKSFYTIEGVGFQIIRKFC